MVDAAHAHEYAVFLPDKSTAELPGDHLFATGHITGMTLKAILKRVERRLIATGQSADGASKAAGKPDAIRNMRRAVETGRRGISSDTIAALAPILQTTSSWLLEGEGAETVDLRSEDVAAQLDRPQKRKVQVKGYVGAGSVAHFYALSDEDFDEVDAPLDATDQTIAVEIRGKSFGPLMDNWLVFYDDVRSPVTEDLLNEICVVGLADDRILIKQIKSDGTGGYNLISNSGEDIIFDAEIEWAAKVTNMRPR